MNRFGLLRVFCPGTPRGNWLPRVWRYNNIKPMNFFNMVDELCAVKSFNGRTIKVLSNSILDWNKIFFLCLLSNALNFKISLTYTSNFAVWFFKNIKHVDEPSLSWHLHLNKSYILPLAKDACFSHHGHKGSFQIDYVRSGSISVQTPAVFPSA